MVYIELHTDRLWMRPYQLADTEALHLLWTEPSVRKYLLDNKIVSKEWVTEAIESNSECFQKNGFGQWGVFLKGKQELVGFCGFGFFPDLPEPQLIFGLAPIYWGQGLATEAVKAVIRYGFEEIEFEQIIGSTNTPNIASARLMERVGMHFNKQVKWSGQDIIYFSISQFEYRVTSVE